MAYELAALPFGKEGVGALSIVTTANVGNPIMDGLTLVMTCDV
jgi:hypothetical protein